MGNQVEKAEIPKQPTNKITRKLRVNPNNEIKKESLYAEDKLFENYENTKILGYRLESDPEDRKYYTSCPCCMKLNLDRGIKKTIECKYCKKIFECDETLDLSYKNNNTAKKVDYLHSLVLLINKDKLSDFWNFYDSQNDIIDYELIMKKILLPYFKIKSRILKNGMLFKIGEIDFRVIGSYPSGKGVISSKTFIQCNNFFSTKTEIKRALMITTIKYENFVPDLIKQEILSGSDPNNLIINKNEIARLMHYEFYVKNCEPSSGILTENTILSIENRDIHPILRLKIAIIKNNVPQFNSPAEKRFYEDYIIKEYFTPYFLFGNKKYVERGDIFAIEDLEMFVLNCYPENGFISSETNVMLKLGLNKEKCLEKINKADNKFANSLIESDRHSNEVDVPQRNYDSNRFIDTFERMIAFDGLLLSGINMSRLNGDDNVLGNVIINLRQRQQKNNELMIKILPTLVVSESYINKMNANKDEATKRCVVCMENFEVKEVLKTLPCFHLFHSNCIDEWLKSNSQCPICKSNLD